MQIKEQWGLRESLWNHVDVDAVHASLPGPYQQWQQNVLMVVEGWPLCQAASLHMYIHSTTHHPPAHQPHQHHPSHRPPAAAPKNPPH